jgi:two-component system osmolarity sensor histidine kinase EnvZ
LPERFRPGRFIKRFLPRGLFGRSLIIIVAPMVLLQGVASYVFFERDLDAATHRMARDIAADAAFLVELENHYSPAERERLRTLASHGLRYEVTFLPGQHILPPPQRTHRRLSTIEEALDDVLAQEMNNRIRFETLRAGQYVNIRINTHDGILQMLVPRDRVTM